MAALQSGDLALAAGLMFDDFVIRGWAREPLGKGGFLAMQSELLNAMPDFSYGLSEVARHNGCVTALMLVSGTHTNDLALPMVGIELIPPTNLTIYLPQVHTEYLLENGKVKEISIEVVPGGGLSGLLQQIATELPVSSRLNTNDIKRLYALLETSM